MALTKVIPSLVAARITPCSTLKFLILQINYFKLLCIVACSYEICAIKVLPHNPHLHLDIFLSLGLDKAILTWPHSPIPPFINVINRNMKYWSQPASSFLSNHEQDDVIPAIPGVITYRSQKTKVPKQTKPLYPLDLNTKFIRGEIKTAFCWDLISIFLIGSLQL